MLPALPASAVAAIVVAVVDAAGTAADSRMKITAKRRGNLANLAGNTRSNQAAPCSSATAIHRGNPIPRRLYANDFPKTPERNEAAGKTKNETRAPRPEKTFRRREGPLHGRPGRTTSPGRPPD